MPKMKTKSGAKKRFKVTGSGKVKAKQAYSRHMMMNKPKSMKRKARGLDLLAEPDQRIVLENFLPYSRGKRRNKAAKKGGE
ncbi:MAG TPA: 50S ribosomal protein L35 [Rhodospirillaceae bacterium]|nr:50S ribosomal protein L35 [Rhodospirillaceae bacterium]